MAGRESARVDMCVFRPRRIAFRRFKPPCREVGAVFVAVQFLQKETQDRGAGVPLRQVIQIRDGVHVTFSGNGGGPVPDGP